MNKKNKKRTCSGDTSFTGKQPWWRRNLKFIIATIAGLVAGGWSIHVFTIKTTGGSSVLQIGRENTYIGQKSDMTVSTIDTNIVENLLSSLIKRDGLKTFSVGNITNSLVARIMNGDNGRFDLNNPTNQYGIALLYAKGIGTKMDYESAAKWMTLASNQGLAPAQFALAIMYNHGLGVSKDEGVMIKLFRQAAEQGHLSAIHNLGVCYLWGWGVKRDCQKAFSYLNKSFEKGYIPSCGVLGFMYVNGDGVKKNVLRGLVMLDVAAEKFDSPLAQHILARMYLDGTHVKKDVEAGMSYMRKAAAQGYPTAQYDLSQIYREGRFVPKQESVALMWEKKAEESEKASILGGKINISFDE